MDGWEEHVDFRIALDLMNRETSFQLLCGYGVVGDRVWSALWFRNELLDMSGCDAYKLLVLDRWFKLRSNNGCGEWMAGYW